MKKRKKLSLTTKILIALVLGAFTGVMLNIFSSMGAQDIIGTWFTGGIFELLGRMFIASIKMLVVPLVLVSLIIGAAGISDIKKLGRVGGKTLLFYISTTAIAITIALSLSYITNPGVGFNLGEELAKSEVAKTQAPSLVDTIAGIIPSNPFTAFSDGKMLQVIFFALIFGFAMAVLGDKVPTVRKFLEELNEIIMEMVMMIMKVAPYGVFALVANVFAKEGFSAFVPLLKYILTVFLALFIHFFVTYSVSLKVFANLSPLKFIKKFYPTMLVAFSTASSNATLPITMETAEKELGVSNKIASFTLPLGATINMDGTAIMQGAAVVFISQAYGIELTLANLAIVVLTATLASIGTAGVPGVGLITLSMVLKEAGLPIEGIALIMGIDRILDMTRTAVNISGDTIVSLIVAKSEGELDEKVFDS